MPNAVTNITLCFYLGSYINKWQIVWHISFFLPDVVTNYFRGKRPPGVQKIVVKVSFLVPFTRKFGQNWPNPDFTDTRPEHVEHKKVMSMRQQRTAQKYLNENKVCCAFSRGKMDPHSSNPAASTQPKLSPKSVASYAGATCREVVLQDSDKFFTVSQERIFKIRNTKGVIMLLVIARQPEELDIVGIAPTSKPSKWRVLGANRVSPSAYCLDFEKALSKNPSAIPSWLAKLWRSNDPKFKCESNYQIYSVDGKRNAKRQGILRVMTYNMLAPCYFRLRTARGETRLESDFPVLYGRCLLRGSHRFTIVKNGWKCSWVVVPSQRAIVIWCVTLCSPMAVERLRKIAAALLRLKADVLLLQEVCFYTRHACSSVFFRSEHVYAPFEWQKEWLIK